MVSVNVVLVTPYLSGVESTRSGRRLPHHFCGVFLPQASMCFRKVCIFCHIEVIVTCTPIAFLEHAIEAQSIYEYEAPKSHRNESCLTTTEMTNKKRTYMPKVRGMPSHLHGRFNQLSPNPSI